MNAFMQMHESIRAVYRAVVAAGNTPVSNWEMLLEEAFIQQGLHEHGYVDDYRGIAKAMLKYFLESRAGAVVEPPTVLLVSFETEEIEVRPDEVLVRDGVRTLRRVKTGHARSTEQKDMSATAFVLAARQAFPDARVELVYLADAEAKPLALSTKELGTRQGKLRAMLNDIRAGRFNAEKSEFSCPGCPAFFICGATPPGTLLKSF